MADQVERKDMDHEQFFRHFQQQVGALRQKLSSPEDQISAPGLNKEPQAIDEVLAGIAQLSTEVNDASTNMPAHDQRNYAETIKSLNHEVQAARAALAPKPKFSFKSGAKLAAAKKTTAPTLSNRYNDRTLHRQQSSDANEATSVDKPDAERTPAGPDSRTMIISDREEEHITPPYSKSPVDPTSQNTIVTSGTLSGLRHCVVDFLEESSTHAAPPTPNQSPHPKLSFAGLHIKNTASSLLLLSPISGAVHITGLQNSVLVVTTRQFRMHDSKNCDVYVDVRSRSIIENCKDIRFAPLPEIFKTAERNVPAVAGDHVGEKLTDNTWTEVDDFNWLRNDEPSPNWRILESTERIKDAVWTEVRKEKREILQSLGKVGIQR